MDIEQASVKFREIYGREPTVVVFAPGRVNLIGEHTDYNDGFVFPFALPFRTVIVASKSDRSMSRIYSCNIHGDEAHVEFQVDKNLTKGTPFWANYVKGTVFQYVNDLPENASFDAVFTSDIPLGSGLSSSAALEVATATMLEALFNITNVNGVSKALRCQKAEHDFADTPCGIMDQFISAMGREGHILLIDCRSQEYKLIALGGDISDPDCPVMLVTNTNVKHSLSGSEYPDRVRQCKEAVQLLKNKYPEVHALRDGTMEMLEATKSDMSDVVYRRALHSIGEDRRTLDSIEALSRGDFQSVGNNMVASHNSLRDNYEVSCEELDILVNLAMEIPGVYGSRMTGGGFGGCTITLLKKSVLEQLKQHLVTRYHEITGKHCDCYEAIPSAGATVVRA